MLYFLMGLFTLFSPAFADDAEPEESGRKIVYKQKTEIDFESFDVEATIQKPQSALILERKKSAFNPLVKIRSDWDDLIEEGIGEAK